MKSDKSVILLKQYAYKKYNYININDLNSIVKCKEFIGIKRTEITKHDLFFKIYSLGKGLFNELEDLEINMSIEGFFDGKEKDREQSIQNLLKKGNKIINYAEIIEDEFFKDIIKKINSSRNAQSLILEWYNTYGVPNLYDEMICSYREIKPTKFSDEDIELIKKEIQHTELSAEDIELIKKHINSTKYITEEKNCESHKSDCLDLDDKLEVSTSEDNKLLKLIIEGKIPKICKSSCLDSDDKLEVSTSEDIKLLKLVVEGEIPEICKSSCLELVNFSLLIYIIYSINKMIKKANETNRFKKLINVFPELFDEYQENGFDLDNNNLFMKYLLEIIKKVNRSIDNSFFDFVNYETYDYDIENEFPTSLEELEDENKDYKIELLKVATIIRNPISFAWRYLLKLLTIDNYEDGYYWCDNCNEILPTNTVLCYSCKKSLGNMYLNNCRINLTLRNEIEKELEDKNYLNVEYPKGPIVHQYQNIRKHAKYNKKRK